MAGLFGKRGEDKEFARQNAIKLNLNKELSAAIKKLQKDHIGSDSAIRSGDTANKICNLLEAIFLHELKDSYSSRTFWPFISKFTHRDTIEQIKQLPFINTEIGQCRAWVRMAVNDCLMDSYLGAILMDTSSLKNFYKKGAFLRDNEQPQITQNYLQGLANFVFQLSYNSSVLNMWGSSLLLLTGTPTTPAPPVLSNSQISSGPLLAIPSQPISDLGSSYHESEFSKGLLQDDTSSTGSGINSHRTSFSHEYSKEGMSHMDANIQDVDDNIVVNIEERNDVSKDIVKAKMDEDLLNPFYSDAKDDDDDYVNQNQTDISHKEKTVTPPDFYSQPQDIYSQSPDFYLDSSKYTTNLASQYLNVEVDYNTQVTDIRKVYAETEESPEPTGQSHEDQNQSFADDEPIAIPIHQTKRSTKEEIDIPESNPFSEEEKSLGSNDIERAPYQEGQDLTEEMVEDEDDGEGVTEEDLSFLQGNSLGGKQGWSSDFPSRIPSAVRASRIPLRDQPSVSAESYDQFLQKYISKAKPMYNKQSSLFQSKDSDQTSDDKENKSPSSTDIGSSMEEDFEVISSVNPSSCKYTDACTEELLEGVTKLGREKGLDSQNYQCKGCSRPVGIIYGPAKVCNYDGCYYCKECHLDDEMVIPARIIYNWDFRKHNVARHTKIFLNQIETMPVIDLKECNMSLYKVIPEMEQIQILRTQLKYLKAYLFTCKQSVAEELRKKIWPREYMLDRVDLFSVQDLIQVQGGSLAPFLRKVILFAVKHVQHCGLCSQKGFICEICDSEKIIYPFDMELTVRCDKCHSVFHKACKTENKPCPRCLRRKPRQVDELDSSKSTDTAFASPFT